MVTRVVPRPEHIPNPQGAVARALYRAASTMLDANQLSFGGGTVLAARWQHRTSLDVDLFCVPRAWRRLSYEQLRRLEQEIRNIPGCQRERSCCHSIAAYAEIHDIEATILPRDSGGDAGLDAERRTELTGSHLRLQNTEEILYEKIHNRLYEAEEITVRDVYDIAAASIHEPTALRRTTARIGPYVIEEVCARIERLPEGWTSRQEQALIHASHDWSEREMIRAAVQGLRPQRRSRNRERER